MTAGALPRHQARATRETGRRTRSALLDAAARLFAERGLAGVSLAGIAAAADAFPSQVTYYFGSKEALFVEAASREMLHTAARVEAAGSAAAGGPAEYVRAMAAEAIGDSTLLLFADALLLCNHRPELRPLVARTLDRLHREGGRALGERCARDRWELAAPPEVVGRAFWAVLLGLVMEAAGSGAPVDPTAVEAAVVSALAARPSSA
ncbi:MAG TPA: TetR/AcrR family transcriptional regulator C-terminal domain-containing protein [Candidatus Dormibacteraeota bacterium]